MLDKDGVFMLRESVKAENNSERGNNFYTALKLKHFEDVMKEVGLFFFKVDELEYTYPDESMPCEKEFYWAVFKDKTTW